MNSKPYTIKQAQSTPVTHKCINLNGTLNCNCNVEKSIKKEAIKNRKEKYKNFLFMKITGNEQTSYGIF